MTLLQDVRAAGPAALRLPRAVLHRGCAVTRETPAGGGRAPVVLLHGYAGTNVVWDPLVRELAVAGFGHVYRLSYNSFAVEVAEVLGAVAALAGRAAQDADAAGVHLVGHSLGGVLARCAVQRDLLPVPAITVATIAAPHAGSPLAALALGPCARLLRPGSPAPDRAPARHAATRWVAYWSDGDKVVPPWSARLAAGKRVDATGHGGADGSVGIDVEDVHVPGQGHLTLCRDKGLLRHLTAELLRSDARAAASDACVA